MISRKEICELQSERKRAHWKQRMTTQRPCVCAWRPSKRCLFGRCLRPFPPFSASSPALCSPCLQLWRHLQQHLQIIIKACHRGLMYLNFPAHQHDIPCLQHASDVKISCSRDWDGSRPAAFPCKAGRVFSGFAELPVGAAALRGVPPLPAWAPAAAACGGTGLLLNSCCCCCSVEAATGTAEMCSSCCCCATASGCKLVLEVVGEGPGCWPTA